MNTEIRLMIQPLKYLSQFSKEMPTQIGTFLDSNQPPPSSLNYDKYGGGRCDICILCFLTEFFLLLRRKNGRYICFLYDMTYKGRIKME